MKSVLFTTTAWPVRWSGGFRWWHSVGELRDFGMTWAGIRHAALTRDVVLPRR
jgi:hypothetical protein